MTDLQVLCLAVGAICQLAFNVIILVNLVRVSNKVNNAPSGLYD